MDYFQGEVEILLVASCYGNRDKVWPYGPLGLYTFFYRYYMQSMYQWQMIGFEILLAIVIGLRVQFTESLAKLKLQAQ